MDPLLTEKKSSNEWIRSLRRKKKYVTNEYSPYEEKKVRNEWISYEL